MHEQMKKDQEKYAAVEDPEQTSLGLSGIKIQDMAAKRYAISLTQTPHVCPESTTTTSIGIG